MKRTFLKAALAGLALTAITGQALATNAWPSQTIKWVVPFPPGGAMDAIARTLGDKLSKSVGQPVVIENRPGAGGTIGSAVVAKAEPDGHTIMIVSIGHALNPNLYKRLSYDAAKDFEPVSLIAVVPNVLVVNSTVKANSVKELIAQAQAEPGKLTFASAGNGTSIHMAGEMFNSIGQVDIMHVPYKGSSPAVTDLISGQVNMMFDSITSAKPHIESGRLRALGVTTSKRSSTLPGVPTMQEAGLPGYEVSPWFAVFAPSGTPKPVVDRLHQELTAAMQLPDVKERFAAVGAEPIGSTPEQLRKYLDSETRRWAKLIAERGITAN